MPKNLEKTAAQVLTQLRHCRHCIKIGTIHKYFRDRLRYIEHPLFMKTRKVANQKLGNFGNPGNTVLSFLIPEFSIDRYITALKQLPLLTQ